MPLLAGATASRAFPDEVRYVVDASDTIVHVNGAWSAFAAGNGAPHLAAPHVLGRRLWDFVGDEHTRELYRSVMRRVRDGGRSAFHFRCDSPEWRRYMLMSISPASGRRLLFDSATLRVEPSTPVSSPSPWTAPDQVRVCSWCMSVFVEDGWVDSETALPARGLFSSAWIPDAAHGVCPICFDRVMDSVSMDGPAAAE